MLQIRQFLRLQAVGRFGGFGYVANRKTAERCARRSTDQPINQPVYKNQDRGNMKRVSTEAGPVPVLKEAALVSLLDSNTALATAGLHHFAKKTAKEQVELGFHVISCKDMQNLVTLMLDKHQQSQNSYAVRVSSALSRAKIVLPPAAIKNQFVAHKVQSHIYHQQQLPHDKVFEPTGYRIFSFYKDTVEGHSVTFYKFHGSGDAIQHVKAYCIDTMNVSEKFVRVMGNDFHCAFIQADFPLDQLAEETIEVEED